MNRNVKMESKIVISKDMCELEVVKYIAFRYNTTPARVIEHYLVQCGIMSSGVQKETGYSLTPNEMALFHDLGVGPSKLVIK